jgi:hypothetical protein
MRNLAMGLALGGAALLGVGAASAQGADPSMSCVYDALTVGNEDYEIVAEVFIYGDVPDTQIQQAAKIVEDAKKACAAKFPLTPGQIETVGELGVYAASIDYLSEELLIFGATEESVGGVLDVYDMFTDADVDKFFDMDWRSDATFYGKLKSQVVGVGIPDEDDMVDLALSILEIAAFAEESTYLFILDDAPPEAKPN